MSGASRASSRSAGARPRAATWASPFSSNLDSTVSALAKTGTEASYIDSDMDILLLQHRPARPCGPARSEEHTSELQSLMRISYAVFCFKKKKHITHTNL